MTRTPSALRAPALQVAVLRAPALRVPVLAFVAALVVAADVLFDPVHRHVPLCPFHAATGLLCPLCGGLRAVDALAHLQVVTAFRDNALLVAAAPILFAWWVFARKRRLPASLVLIAAVAFTVVRNLPFATMLRP